MASLAMGGEQGWEWSATSQIKDILGDLLTKGFQSDLTIVLGAKKDREVHVHKLILQCRSRILHSKIMKCGDRLELEDVEDYESFMKMLKYLYTGDSEATINEALPLHKMASDFEVVGLIDQCGTLCNEEVTEHNVLPLFEDAMKYVHKGLIGSTLQFICCNAHQIINLHEFSQLRLECLIEIIQQDDLRVKDEMAVFNAVYEWGQAECKRQGFDPPNHEEIRILLAKPLKHIRFPLMDKDEFVLNVATKELLTTDEVMGILMCFVMSPEKRPLLPHGRFISTPRKFIKKALALGWEICRSTPGNPLKYDIAPTLHEYLAFHIEGEYYVELKKVLIQKEVVPSYMMSGKCWVEKCGSEHQWNNSAAPFQVDILLFDGNQEVIRKSQWLELSSPEGYSIPFVSKLKPHTDYEILAMFGGKTVCSDYSNCSYSPLNAGMVLNMVSNFNANSTPTILDNNGTTVVSPPFKIRFERKYPYSIGQVPITQGFIERLVFDIEGQD